LHLRPSHRPLPRKTMKQLNGIISTGIMALVGMALVAKRTVAKRLLAMPAIPASIIMTALALTSVGTRDLPDLPTLSARSGGGTAADGSVPFSREPSQFIAHSSSGDGWDGVAECIGQPSSNRLKDTIIRKYSKCSKSGHLGDYLSLRS